MDLDQLLDTSAPRVAARTPELQRELDHLVAGSTRVVLVGGVAAALLSLSAMASAAGILPGWPSFSTSSGQVCRIQVTATPLAAGNGEPSSSAFSTAERTATLAAAQEFLSGFDFDAVDRGQAIAWWQAEESRARSSQSNPADQAPRLTGDDLEVTAVSTWVVQRLRSHLAVQGLDIRAINVTTSSSGCTL
jgi:hypothetical protein